MQNQPGPDLQLYNQYAYLLSFCNNRLSRSGIIGAQKWINHYPYKKKGVNFELNYLLSYENKIFCF